MAPCLVTHLKHLAAIGPLPDTTNQRFVEHALTQLENNVRPSQ